MLGLPPVSKEEGSSLRAFVQANQSALWKVSYFVIAVFLFSVAAQKRFSWPEVPLADNDPGYLWPALIKLNASFPRKRGLVISHRGLNSYLPSIASYDFS